MKRDTAEGAEQRRAAGKIMSIIEAGRNEGIFDDDEAEIAHGRKEGRTGANDDLWHIRLK